jgi:hypothetical protein
MLTACSEPTSLLIVSTGPAVQLACQRGISRSYFFKSPPAAEFHTSIFCVAHVLWAYHGPLDLDPIHQMVRG